MTFRESSWRAQGDGSQPSGEIHYVRDVRSVPPCGETGHYAVTTAFWDVTCDPCLHSLPLAMDQFLLAYRQLLAALRLSFRSRRSGISS